MAEEDSSVTLPPVMSPEWVNNVQAKMNKSTWKGVRGLREVLPKQVAISILERTERLVAREKTVVEVVPASPEMSVVVVGDTHGQFHDVCRMLEVAGPPSQHKIYIFNGDFVDRGAWGMETLILLCCWKLALPNNVFMLRGNHETATCSILYGFKGELEAKYGKSAWKGVFAACKKMFAALPLAAVVNRRTLVLHGGLFRRPPTRSTGKTKRKKLDSGEVGSLEDLQRASKGGLDPGGLGASRVATDILWSDPTKTPGFKENDARGIGMTFGPEITEQFLRENNLKLILRSHEGPDAREDREDMGSMLEGWTEDHVTPAGRLVTVFSAPDYPQFMAAGASRYSNKAAVAVLTSPDYDNPSMTQYEAVHPRPEAKPYYDLAVNDSDEELEPVAPTASGMTDVREEKSVADGAAEASSAPGEEEREEEAQNGGEAVAVVAAKEEEKEAAAAAAAEPGSSPVVALCVPKVEKGGEQRPGSPAVSPKAHSRGTSPTRWHPHVPSA